MPKQARIISLNTMNKVLYRVPGIPRQVDMMFTNLCNLDCKMCPKYFFKLKEKHMSIETFKKIADRLDGVEQISLIGYGEPLLNPAFFKAVEYGKKKGFKMSAVSNGYMLCSKKVFESLVGSDIDCIRFSIETIKEEDVGGHVGSKKVLGLIEKLKREWVKLGKKNEVIINTVVYNETYDNIIPIIEWAERAGLDMVDVAHYNKLGAKIESILSLEKEITLYEKIKKRHFKIPVATLYDRYRGIRRIAFRYMKKCPMAFDDVHIDIDGGISPCICGLPTTIFGNILKDDLREIWNGDRFKQFRKNQERICAKCTLFKLYG